MAETRSRSRCPATGTGGRSFVAMNGRAHVAVSGSNAAFDLQLRFQTRIRLSDPPGQVRRPTSAPPETHPAGPSFRLVPVRLAGASIGP